MKYVIGIICMLFISFQGTFAQVGGDITRSLGNNDVVLYKEVKSKLPDAFIKNVDKVLEKYEAQMMRLKWSEEKRAQMREQIVVRIENMIFELLQLYPQDIVLPDEASELYNKLVYLKFKFLMMGSEDTIILQGEDIISLRDRLTPLQYEVTQNGATEKPFQNAYHDNEEEGIYVDIIDGTVLFSSTHKYKTNTGWPAFTQPINESVVKELEDTRYGMIRTEVKSISSDSHLGHIFTDGPKETGGLRYCINSASLDFVPKDQLEQRGYGEYIPLFE